MSPAPDSDARPGRRAIVVAALGGLAILVAWMMLELYQSPASRDCLRLYRAARTAADSALVDATFPDSARAGPEAHSCRFIRSTARWR